MPGCAGFLPSTLVHVKYLSTIDMEGLLSYIKYFTKFRGGGGQFWKACRTTLPEKICKDPLKYLYNV